MARDVPDPLDVPDLSRRRWLQWCAASGLLAGSGWPRAALANPPTPANPPNSSPPSPLTPPGAVPPAPTFARFPVVKPRRLEFPRDHGAHPDYRTEWWYATGWLERTDGAEMAAPLGFQVTFFRSRTTHAPANPSRFAPHQLLFAHVAIADPQTARLRHDQRVARVIPDAPALAAFSTTDSALNLQGWQMQRNAQGAYVIDIDSDVLALQLQLAPTQPLLLQGEGGFSRKGAAAGQASHYYSQPQLAVSGSVRWARDPVSVRGRAWLDHEWSSRVLNETAAGWDWIGINLDDGGALMAFRIRAKDGGAPRWATARWRDAAGRERSYARDAVVFEPLATWRSPLTGASYPVRLRLRLGHASQAGAAETAETTETTEPSETFEIEPLFDDQELDSRRSTGAVYWEGAVTLRCAGQRVGRGYLELVGYHRAMQL